LRGFQQIQLIVSKQLNPGSLKPHRLWRERPQLLGFCTDLLLDVTKFLILPRPTAFNPLLSTVGLAPVFEASRLSPHIAVARFGESRLGRLHPF
jgi:hypothetical protein